MPKGIRGRAICSIAGCDAIVLARTWCDMHYRRWQRHGDPLVGTRRAQIVMDAGVESKRCSVCRSIKPLTSFFRDSHTAVGYSSTCKVCRDTTAKAPAARARRNATQNRRLAVHRANDPERFRGYRHARRARFYQAPGVTTKAEKAAILLAYDGRCAYVGCTLPKYAWDHVVPLCRTELGPTNWPWNLVPACEHHNASKRDRTPDEWVAVGGVPLDLGPHPFLAR